MHGAPVGGDEALEADLIAQDFRQRVGIAAGKGAVNAVVGAHDRRDAGLDRGIEGGDVDFVQGLVVNDSAAALGVVADVVLDLGHDMLRLNALDFSRADLTGKEGIFAKGVVAAAELEVAVDVDEGLQRDIDAEGARFASDDQAVLFGVLTLKVAATPMVAVSPCDGCRVSTPGGPSAKRRPGMPRRGMPAR